MTACWIGLVSLLLATPASPSPRAAAPRPPDRQLVDIPRPALADADPVVAEQITARFEEAERLGASPDADPAEIARAYGMLGQILLLYDMLEPAEAAFENVLALAPRDHRGHYYLGVITQELRRLDEAREHFEMVVELDPSYLSALVRLGDVERFAGHAEAARQWYERALEVAPGTAAAHWGLGQLATTRGDPSAAVEHFEAVLELQPEASVAHYPLGIAYRELGRMEKAREHFLQRGERTVTMPDPLIDALAARIGGLSLYMNRGNSAYARGDYQTAATVYRMAVEEDPESTEARHALASSLSRLGKLGEAVEQLRILIEQHPDDAMVHYNLGAILSELGEFEEALASYRRAVELSPELADARFNLGLLLERMGRLEEALQQFRAVEAIDPEDTEATIRRLAVLTALGRPQEVEPEIRRILSVDPTNLEARLTLAATAAALGRADEAISQYRQVLDGAETVQVRARASFGIGKLLLMAGDAPGAIGELERTVELMPGIANVRLVLGNALAQSQRFEEAATQFGAAVELDPSSLTAHIGRAIALLMARQDARARDSLQESLSRLPGEPELIHLLARVLATSSEASVRDGERAFALAQQAMASQPSTRNAETVAMALAELGRFDAATEIQRRLRDQAEQGPERALVEHRLGLYERQKPVRAPWLDTSGPVDP